MLTPFHLAIPVHDLDAARRFYGDQLGCPEGRSDSHWIDFDLYGHQLVCHLIDGYQVTHFHNPVDTHPVPIPHFGVVLEMTAWLDLANKLEKAGTEFVLKPYQRFAGEAGEQGTFFILDPSGNALEFKGFVDIQLNLFKK